MKPPRQIKSCPRSQSPGAEADGRHKQIAAWLADVPGAPTAPVSTSSAPSSREAKEFADGGRVERLRAEIDHLMTELAARFGSRAPRRGPTETARKAVTKVIRTQIGRLLELHLPLGRHLSETVRMGTVCVDAPGTRVEWDVGG
jgi:hypothetical protein